MKCKNCGANITREMIECEYCGSVVDLVAAGDTAAIAGGIVGQRWTALLTAEERQTLLSYLETNKRILAIKFVVSRLGLSMEQGTEMIEQLEAHKEVCIPDVDTLMERLIFYINNDILFFDENEERITKAKRGAMNKYLLKLGYTPNDKILLLYNGAAIKKGESGFTITDRGFYSSGSFMGGKEFFLPLNEFKTVEIDINELVINDKKVSIDLILRDDYYNLCAIVAGIIRTNR